MIVFILIIAIGSLVSSYGLIHIKRGSDKLKFSVKDILRNFNLLFGMSLFAFGLGVFIVCLKYADLSYLYPITSLGHVFVVFLSAKLLGEKINSYKIVGITLIAIGILVNSL